MKLKRILALPFVAVLAACAQPASEAPGVLAADPWVRTTDGAADQTMTALFVNLTNPSSEDRLLTGVVCEGDVAEAYELHEMAMVDGSMVMRETETGIPIEAGKHQHLAPGGYHVMLMGLSRELPAGSEEITCTLTIDDGQEIEIVAPVKQFTGEMEPYHEHAEDGSEITPSAMPGHG